MEDFEKELQAVVDDFTTKKVKIKQKQKKEKLASDQKMKTFQQIVSNVIHPVILECRDFINKKGEVSK